MTLDIKQIFYFPFNFVLAQLLPDRRRVETSQCLSHVVCVHIYIYVVCEPRHGEFDTSAAAQHTQQVTI
jgi:hypothetical protein